MDPTIGLSLIGALSVLSAGISGVTLYMQLRPSPIGDLHQLEQHVTSLKLQLNDLVDKFTTQERRDRVRRLRESRDEPMDTAQPQTPVEIRQALRKRTFAAHFGGNGQ